MSLRVGIDFGTSNSGVAVSDGRQVRILPVDQRNITPEVVKSILYITRDDRSYIGQEAVELYYRQNVNRRRRFVKKWAGEVEYRGADMYYVTDLYTYVDELMPGRLMQFLKTALRSGDVEGTQVFDRYYSVVDIIAIYLRHLKERAEAILGETIGGVTLGRPVKFSSNSERDRQAQESLSDAARKAGFEDVEFEMEPVAAALYYELRLTRPQTVLIFDFGGGTLDITIMRLGDSRRRQVYANGGIDVAGSDFDRAIIRKRMLKHFGKGLVDGHYEINNLVDAVADWQTLPELSVPRARMLLNQAINAGEAPARLRSLEALIFQDLAFSFYRAVEEGKIRLSDQGASVIGLEDNQISIWELYTRAQFENDIREYRAQIETVLRETIAASGFEVDQVDAVVKTGGSSSIPLFGEMLAKIFGPEKIVETNAFSSVTAGLAIRAAGRRAAG